MVTDFLSGIVEKIKALNIGEDDLFKIKVALGEALVNAIKHGNSLNPKRLVHFELESKAGRIIFKIRDQGPGFDFENLPDPTQDENLEKGSGRGVFLIRSLMDEVLYSDHGREIKMVKFIKK